MNKLVAVGVIFSISSSIFCVAPFIKKRGEKLKRMWQCATRPRFYECSAAEKAHAKKWLVAGGAAAALTASATIAAGVAGKKIYKKLPTQDVGGFKKGTAPIFSQLPQEKLKEALARRNRELLKIKKDIETSEKLMEGQPDSTWKRSTQKLIRYHKNRKMVIEGQIKELEQVMATR